MAGVRALALGRGGWLWALPRRAIGTVTAIIARARQRLLRVPAHHWLWLYMAMGIALYLLILLTQPTGAGRGGR